MELDGGLCRLIKLSLAQRAGSTPTNRPSFRKGTKSFLRLPEEQFGIRTEGVVTSCDTIRHGVLQSRWTPTAQDAGHLDNTSDSGIQNKK